MTKKRENRKNNSSNEEVVGARVNKNKEHYKSKVIKKTDLNTIDEILGETEKFDLTNVKELTNDDLDLTNVGNLTFDEVRLMDTDSLDTSFLEGRKKKSRVDRIIKDTPKKVKKDGNVKEESKVKDERKESKKKEKKVVKKKKSGFKILLFILISFAVGFGSCFVTYNYLFKPKTKVITKVKIKKEVVPKIDDNYVFLGDSITDFYDLDKYYKDKPVVNSGIGGNTTKNILDDMNNRVYKYNPSKVFLLIGTNDFIFDISNEDTVKNIKKIIEGIKENRPSCEIYLESIYPINDSDDDKIDHDMVHDRSNKTIKKVNKELESLAKEEKINYIDMYSLLEDSDGNLELDYTKEGLHMSDDGYRVITKEIKKYLEK